MITEQKDNTEQHILQQQKNRLFLLVVLFCTYVLLTWQKSIFMFIEIVCQ